MFVYILLSLQICFNIKSILKSNGTFRNSNFTSNNISLWSDSMMDIVFIKLINSMLLLTVYSDLLNDDSVLAKYFAMWYEAVEMLKIIGHNRKSSSSINWDFIYLGCYIKFAWYWSARIECSIFRCW